MIDVVIPGNTTKLDQPKRDEWVRAAKHWRYPYWDWGLSPDVPAICKQKDVTVDMPDGPVQRKNPFFKFTMPKQALFKDHDVGDMKDQKGNVVVPVGSVVIFECDLLTRTVWSDFCNLSVPHCCSRR